MLGVELHAPKGLFYSLKGPRSRWSSVWKAMVAFCPRVHWTIRCTPDNEQCAGRESLIGCFPVPRGTGPSGAPLDRWPEADVAVSRCTTGTPDCPAPREDRLMNYSQCRLEFSRAGCWPDRAPNCPVVDTEPSGALQSNTFPMFLSLISFSLFWTCLYEVFGTLRQYD
jgi:hypothetical protein